MTAELLVWSFSVVVFTFYLLVHVVYFRFLEPRYKFRALKLIFCLTVIASWFILGAVYLRFETDWGSNRLFQLTHGIAVFFFLVIGYCSFYSLIDRSVSVRISRDLWLRKNSPVDLRGLVKSYSPEDSLLRRLSHMEDRGLVSKTAADHWVLTHKGRRIAQFVRLIKQFLRLGPGG